MKQKYSNSRYNKESTLKPLKLRLGFLMLLCLLFVNIAKSQVTPLQDWSKVYTRPINNGGASITNTVAYPISSGTNRFLVVAIAAGYDAGPTTVNQPSVTWGGKTLMASTANNLTSNRSFSFIYYLKEVDIATATGNDLIVNMGSSSAWTGYVTFAAVYSKVNQTTLRMPGPDNLSGSPNNTATITTNFTAGDQGIFVAGWSIKDGDTTSSYSSVATNWSGSASLFGGDVSTSGSGIGNYFGGVGVRTVTTADPSETVSMTTTNTKAQRPSISIISLTPAKYFRSKVTGNWSATGTWEESSDNATWVNALSVPDSGDVSVTIQNSHTVTVNANSTAPNLIVKSGGILATSGAFTFSVSGTTNATGTLTLAGTGAKTFTGDTTLNSGAVWNETGISTYAIAGSFTNNATTFTANTGVHTFFGTTKTISGSTTTSIPSVAVTGTYTNSGTLTVATALSGTGGLTNASTGTLNISGTCSVATLTNNGNVTSTGTGTITSTTITNNLNWNMDGTGTVTAFTNAANGVLNIGATPTAPTFTTLTTSADGNTVNYDGAGAQTVKVNAYSNLILSGSGAKTITGVGTVNGNFTMSGDNTTTASTTVSFNVGGNLTVGAGNTLTLGNNNPALTLTGNASISGTVTSPGAAKTIGGNFTINSGGSWTESGNSPVYDINGNFLNNGTFSAGSSPTYSIAGDFTNNSTFTAGSGLVTFDGSAQSIGGTSSTTFPQLTLSSSGTKTFGIGTTVAGLLTISLGVKADLGSYKSTAGTLKLAAGTTITSGSYGGGSNSPAATVDATYFNNTSGYFNVGTCTSYSLTSTTGATICKATAATITVASTNTSTLPTGTYTVNYTLTGVNTGTFTASMSVISVAGTGSFTTGSLANSGSTAITINYLTNGCVSSLSANNTATITVNPVIAGNTSGSAVSICNNTSTTLTGGTATGGSGSYTYLWESSTSLGGTYAVAAGTNNTANYTTATLITASTPVFFRRTVTSGGCTDIATGVQVTVRPAFVSGAIPTTGEIICYGGNPSEIGSTTAASGGDNTITYSWRSSADSYTAAISGATSATFLPPAGLTATTSYQRYSKDGTCNTTPTVSSGTWSVTVNPLPVVAAIAGGATTVCVSSATPAFTDATNGGVWSITAGVGTASITAGGVVNGITAGTVTVVYTVTSDGCTNTATKGLTVNPLPVVAAIAGGAATVCVSSTTPAFTDATNGGVWSITAGIGTASITAGGVVTGITAGTVTVVYTVTSDGCTNTATKILTVNPLPTSIAITAVGGITENSTTVCAGGSITLRVEGTYTAYSWSTGETASTISATASGPYYVQVTDANGCKSLFNSSFRTVKVLVSVGGSIAGSATVCSGTNSTVLTLSNYTGNIEKWQYSTSSDFSGTYFDITDSQSSRTVTNLTTTTYYRAVIKNATCALALSTTATVTVNSSKAWTGATNSSWFTASNWSCGSVPTATSDVIIPNVATKPIVDDTSTTALANTITVQSSSSLTVNSGNTLKVTDKLTNDGGTITFEDSASLVQTNPAAVNSGNILYKRTTSILANNYDFVYWSSPVAPQEIGKIWMASNWADTFYNFNPEGNNWARTYAGDIMIAGKGYIARARNGQSGVDYADVISPPFIVGEEWSAKFFGKPNNGIITVTDCVAGEYCLLGNPYPSAIDADIFLTQNSTVLEGTLYFWTHNTKITDNAYTSDDYASYNGVGGTKTTRSSISSGLNTNIPSGKIAAGQGFFAKATATANVTFNNTMRLAGTTSLDGTGINQQFFRTSSAKAKTANSIEKHRVWLNVSNTQGAFKQTLVGYVTDATNGYDSRFDGESMNGNTYTDFYSINENKNLTIQGRALPFDPNDTVPLGFKTTIAGSFIIDIDEVDGLLANQAVYLEDKVTNTVSNLKNGNYTFTTSSGTFNDRFVLRYTDKTLGAVDVEKPANQVVVSIQNKQIKITSFAETIEKVLVFDLSGKQRYQKRAVNNTELLITTLAPSHQMLLVKTVLQNGKSSIKKVLF